MNRFLLLFAATLFYLATAGQSSKQKVYTGSHIVINPAYSKASELDSILKSYAPASFPGASLAIYSEAEGWWGTAAGYSDLKQKLPMTNEHLQYLQSVSKMYMAVAILQLKEQGKIDLDQPITRYLSPKHHRYIKNAEKVTVRTLLNHTSGVPEYLESGDFMSARVLNPTKNFSPIDCLKAIADKELEWEPGTRYRYVNTNYVILALIGDHITGDHGEFMRKNIFERLALKNTWYERNPKKLASLNVPTSYWDVFNSGMPIDVTPFQQMAVSSSVGDDGIACTTFDAVKFLKGLMEGKLLQPESMKEMMTFVKDEQGRNRYGMGMIYIDVDGTVMYGHGGGGVGAGCGLLYIPDRKVYVFMATNLAVFPDGKLPEKVGAMRDAILNTLIRN